MHGPPLPRRHRSAALVCRRWVQLVHSPQLLADVSFSISDDDSAGFLRRLRAAGTWLVRRAAPHVRRLQLELIVWMDYTWEDQHKWEAGAALAGPLAACTQLQDLELLVYDVPLPLGSWLAPLGSTLRRLVLATDDDKPLRVGGGLDALWALEQLELRNGDEGSGPLSIEPTARLPAAALTRLVLGNLMGVPALPQQVGLWGDVLQPALEGAAASAGQPR